MSEETDPAADPETLQERLLKAAKRQARPSVTDKIVAGGDRARVIKLIRAAFDIGHGEYTKDAPTNDELVNLCLGTMPARQAHWMLFVGRARQGLDLLQLIKKPMTAGGVPARQIQIIENDLNGPAWDIYQGLRVVKQNVGLVVRLGPNGLFVYGHLNLVPPESGSASFCLGDPEDEEDWRALFPLEGLLPAPQE